MSDRELTPADIEYFTGNRDGSRTEYGVLWPEHQWAGETVVEHVQNGFVSREAAERVAKVGFNRTYDEYPPHGKAVMRRVEVSPWVDVTEENDQ